MRPLRLLGMIVMTATLAVAAEFGVSPLTAGRVYPNPWRADRHAHFHMVFDGLPARATLHLYTLSGQQIKTLVADETGKVLWDRTNGAGQSVASGVYLYTVADGTGRTSVGKLAIIR